MTYEFLTETATRGRADAVILLMQSIGIEARYVPDDGAGRQGVVVEAERFDDARRALADDKREAAERLMGQRAGHELTLGAASSAWWVGLLVVTNVAIWFLMQRAGGSTDHGVLLAFGAIRTPLLEAGQWWRMVTAMFLHIGAAHLIGNMILLLFLGSVGLRTWGLGRTLSIYVMGGVVGNLAGYLFGSAQALKAGASGAILALLGGLVAARWRQMRAAGPAARYRYWHLLGVVIAFYGMVVGVRPQSDHIAHVGGLVGGAILALLLPSALDARRERVLQWALALGSVAVLALCGLQGRVLR